MYIYYEEFGDITLVALSSNGRDTFIQWKDPKEKAICNLCNGIFKEVELKNRDFNPDTNVWTFIGYVGKVIYTQLESMCTQGIFQNSKVLKIEDLEEKAKRGALNSTVKKSVDKKFEVEDFFYSPPAAAGSTQLSGANLLNKIAEYLAVSPEQVKSASDKDLKRLYRGAALRLHPDRNNGDGSKMSELNMLWGIYMSQGG